MQQNNTTYPFYGPEDIKRYLSGSMSAQEMHDMEKAALKDPMLADAIDGFRGANPDTTDAHLNAIKASILGLSQQAPVVVPLNSTPKTYWWRWVAAACGIVIIAGTSWWMTQKVQPGTLPLAKNEPISLADTAGIAVIAPPVTTEKEAVERDEAETVVDENKENAGVEPAAKTDQAVSAKVLTPAQAEALQAPIAQKIMEDEATAPQKNEFNSELRALKRKENGDDYVSSMIAASAPPAAPMPGVKTTRFGNANGLQPVAYIEGLVVDKEGTPVPNASISLPGRNKTTANNDGSFVLPAYDSSFNASINSVGFQNRVAFLQPGKQNRIVLDKALNHTDEIVVTAIGQTRKRTSAHLGDARKAQAAAVSANEVIYPEEGWSHFYEELGTSLGVDKAKKTKTLQIKFTVDDNGDPVDFEVVESPDAIMAKKAIEFIKKAKWKNFKLDKNALVKIEVN